MIAWLRRHQPKGFVLGTLYWAALTVVALFGLFLLFYYVVDPLLPAMF